MSTYAVSYSYRKPTGESGMGVITLTVSDGFCLFPSGDDVLAFGDRMIEAGKFEPGTHLVVLNAMRLPL